MIIALEEAKYNLIKLREDVKELGSALRIEEKRETVATLEEQTLAPDFWNNQENSSKVLQTIKQTKDIIEGYDDLGNRLEDAIALAEMAIEENDESCVEEVEDDEKNNSCFGNGFVLRYADSLSWFQRLTIF